MRDQSINHTFTHLEAQARFASKDDLEAEVDESSGEDEVMYWCWRRVARARTTLKPANK